jgi:hypothetical protein
MCAEWREMGREGQGIEKEGFKLGSKKKALGILRTGFCIVYIYMCVCTVIYRTVGGKVCVTSYLNLRMTEDTYEIVRVRVYNERERKNK